MAQQPLEFTCNTMEETLAEKVLGFLRCSERLSSNQDSTFSQNPKLILEVALQMARSDSQLKVSYLYFVEDLVAGSAPDFDVALSTFTRLESELIARLN